MQGLPILFLIIAIVSIVNNYKKANAKHVYEQKLKAAAAKKRMEETRENTVVEIDKKQREPAASVYRAAAKATAKPSNHKAAPFQRKISVNAMRQAVITSEILGKPVSLRDE